MGKKNRNRATGKASAKADFNPANADSVLVKD